MMKRPSNTKKLSLALAACLTGFAGTVIPAQLTLLQTPVRSGNRPPAPNIVLSVDDSISMAGQPLTDLKTALKNTFKQGNVADSRIRLAYQSMSGSACRGFPGQSLTVAGTEIVKSCPSNQNRMALLTGADSDTNTHRGKFLAWVNGLSADSYTTSHAVVKLAGDYMTKSVSDTENPWRDTPGSAIVAGEKIQSCRKSFHIFMTDGGWNAAKDYTTGQGDGISVGINGNVDGSTFTLPDGITYSPRAPYKDVYGFKARTSTPGPYSTTFVSSNYKNGLPSTLADLAFYYWATDLQPNVEDKVPKYTDPAATGDVTYTSTTNSSIKQVVTPYWNPKNDPATWQHLTTYTIGFNGAATWGTAPLWDTGSSPTTWSGTDYNNLIAGSLNWPDPIKDTNWSSADARLTELWHMAINGRGEFVPATNATALKDAFTRILDRILVVSEAATTGVAISSNFLNTTGALAYNTGYDTASWTGSIAAYEFSNIGDAANGAKLNPVPVWKGEEKLATQTWDSRVILTSLDTTGVGIPFRWTGGISATQQALFNKDVNGATDALGSQRLRYLRGDNSASNSSTFRVRGTLPNSTTPNNLGDIADSIPWFIGPPNSGYIENNYKTYRSSNAGRVPMIYVGANDGMLHAFRADRDNTMSGSEQFAYIPNAAYGGLLKLTQPTYSHIYTVDSSPFAGDFYNTATNSWKTYLVSTLGSGGKGYFILDVSDPTAVTETTASTWLKKDATFTGTPYGSDDDVGHIIQQPTIKPYTNTPAQIVKLNTGNWAVILGNGFNSKNEKPVLLLQYLNGSTASAPLPAPIKLVAGTSSNQNFVGNGLAAPTPVDIDGNGTADFIYAGDLKGNMWRFDVRSTKTNNALDSATVMENKWVSDAAAMTPIFTAKDKNGLAQAITTQPNVRLNSNIFSLSAYRYMITFGTGKLLESADLTTPISTDPKYTSRETIYSIYDNGTNITTGRTGLIEQTMTQDAIVQGITTRKSATAAVDLNTVRGWYMDLPLLGERIVDRLLVLDGPYVAISSMQPIAGETCSQAGNIENVYTTILNVFNGGYYPTSRGAIFDTNSDGLIGIDKNDETKTDITGIIGAQVDYRTAVLVDNPAGRVILTKKGPLFGSNLQTYTRFGWRELRN